MPKAEIRLQMRLLFQQLLMPFPWPERGSHSLQGAASSSNALQISDDSPGNRPPKEDIVFILESIIKFSKESQF